MQIEVGMHHHKLTTNRHTNRNTNATEMTQTTMATSTESDSTAYRRDKPTATTVIIHGGYQESKQLRNEEIDTESETDSDNSTETSGTELEMNSVNTMSNTNVSRPGAARARGGQYFLPQRDTEHSDDEKRAMPQ